MTLSALGPLLCIPHGLSTLYRYSLTTVAQSKPYHQKPFNQGLLHPQGALYRIQTIINQRSQDQLLEFRTSFHKTISSEFLVQGNFKHTQFSREYWTWQDSNSQPHAPKARAVSIELTWQLISPCGKFIHVGIINSKQIKCTWILKNPLVVDWTTKLLSSSFCTRTCVVWANRGYRLPISRRYRKCLGFCTFLLKQATAFDQNISN